jgi:hypothetical protein
VLKLARFLPEPLFTWWQVGRKEGMLCMAYGGTITPGFRVRVCDKRRGHFDSYTYEFLDVLEAKRRDQPAR